MTKFEKVAMWTVVTILAYLVTYQQVKRGTFGTAYAVKPTPTPPPAASSPTPPPQPVAFTPQLDLQNPFETEEERARKKAYTITDDKGVAWASVSRDDKDDVRRGLPPEQTTIYTGNTEPIVTREENGWKIRFKSQAPPTP